MVDAKPKPVGTWKLDSIHFGEDAMQQATRRRQALINKKTRDGDKVHNKTVPVEANQSVELWYYQLPREDT